MPHKTKSSKPIKKTGLMRNTIDKFYTQEHIVNKCYHEINDLKFINKKQDLIIEPSAGNGSFINIIKKLCNNYQLYDLEPEHKDIIKQNYLSLDWKKFTMAYTLNTKNNKINRTYKKIHIIGNPPFGRQSSTVLKFIKYSAEFCDTMSFILPRSFKKDSLKYKVPLNFHCLHEIDLPNNAFMFDGKPYDVPCVFQIWEKKNVLRNIASKVDPIGYKFVKKCENPDISFRRVGVNAGNIDKKIINKSEQSHYFLKFDTGKFNVTIFKNLGKCCFNMCTNTVGPKSISKPELITQYNKIISTKF